MYATEGLNRLRRRYRYAYFLLDHVFGNRLRKTVLRSFMKPFCLTYHVTDRPHVSPCRLAWPERGASEEASLDEALTLLRKIRKEVRMLVLAGGEPLLHPAITTITAAAHRLGFAPLVLETNFALINEREEALRHCHLVVVPLETADGPLQATLWGCDPLWVERIKKNLVHYGARQKEFGVRLVVKCIIREETLDETYDLMEFCFLNNLLFTPTISPTLGLPDRGLRALPTYERLVDYIVARKKAGAPILGRPDSLRLLLTFESLPCYPTLAPHMAPSGEVFYPCHARDGVGGNFLAEKALSTLHRRAELSLGAWREEWHDCRLHGYVTNTWVLEQFLNRPLEGFIPPTK